MTWMFAGLEPRSLEPFENRRKRVRRVTTSYTIQRGDYYIGVTDTSSAWTMTFPLAAAVPLGEEFIVADESGGAGTNAITLAFINGDTCDGGSSVTISSNYGTKTIKRVGATTWKTV